jgi:hypothetical protein
VAKSPRGGANSARFRHCPDLATCGICSTGQPVGLTRTRKDKSPGSPGLFVFLDYQGFYE